MGATATGQAGPNWMRNSVEAYLDGQKDLLWVLATVRGAHSEALALLLTDFEDLSSTSRFRALQQSLTA
jgi:hypothetical protein